MSSGQLFGNRKSRTVTRRRLFGIGMGATTAMLTPGARRGFAGLAGGRIDPGYFAPQFYDSKEREAVLDVVETGSPFRWWGPGATPTRVKSFEEKFAQYMGAKYALAVTSGTAALDCAIAALGVGPGDEVILPAYTWWSDYTCIVHAGALPVFADIDESLNLDPADFARKITSRTKAVIAVHLLGGPADLGPILETARKSNIKVVEDCAQCVGGSYKGKKLGSIGDIGIYSFQLNKMISSGEGGAVVTSDPLLYERAARFHDMGMLNGLFRERIGGKALVADNFAGENFRMNEFTGAVLGAQLPKLDAMIAGLQQAARPVQEEIKKLGLRSRKQPDPAGDLGTAVYIDAPDRAARDKWIKELGARGVPAGTMSGSVMLPAASAVINKQTRNPNWPSFTSPEGRAMTYGPDACKQSQDVYSRMVQIRFGPKYTDETAQRIVAAVREAKGLVG
jgi:8-amino-3,8-dideoxy-alpha-D-manno-octulosonate transaminase